MKAGKKIVAAMTLISIVPCLLIAFMVSQQMQASFQELQRSSLKSMASVVSAHIYDYYRSQEANSLYSGSMTAYREYLKAYAADRESTQCDYWKREVQALFAGELKLDDNVDGGALMDVEGEILLSYGGQNTGKNLKNTEMYNAVMGGQELYRSTVINQDGSRNVDIVVPVLDESGRVMGMLKRIVSLDCLNLYVRDVKIGNNGYIYLIDQDAILLYHGSKTKMDLAVGEFQDRAQLDQLLRDTVAGRLKDNKGIIQYDNQGIDTLAAYSEVGDLNWVVVVAVDNQEVQGPALRATKFIEIFSLFVGTLAIVCCYFIIRRLLKPLTKLKECIGEIAAGDHGVQCVSMKNSEFSPAMEAVNDIIMRLQRSDENVKWAECHDTLTGLPNRFFVLSQIRKQMRCDASQAILLVDLDDFDVINQTLGLNVGDSVLIEVAQKLKSLPECVMACGRFAGDGFVLLVDVGYSGMTPEALAVHLREIIEQIRYVADSPVHITASIGIAYGEDGEPELDIYLKRAGIALYKAKHSGKNTDVVFRDALQ